MVPLRSPARAFLVPLVDAAIIIAASAAIVIRLGGRTRFDAGALRVTLRGATNFLVFAAAFGGVRLWLGRGLRPLPAVPHPDDTHFETERVRFASPAPPTRAVWLYGAAALLGSLVWIAPQLLHIREVPDAGDPIFSAWRIAALTHQPTPDPRHLWNGNIFYPLPLTLNYSDSLLLQSVLAMPFLLAHVDPLVVANALLVVSYPARGLAFFYATWRIAGDPQAALVAALVGTWSPFHSEHYSHLELHWTMFVPLALIALLRMLARPRWKTGALFGAAVAAQCLACMYVGVMLVSVLVPFGLVVALAWRVRPSRPVAAAVIGAALVLLPVAGGLGVTYLKAREAHGERSLGELSDGSATPRDYGNAHIRLVTYRWQSGRLHHGERELFPGASALALAAVGMLPPLTPVTMATIVSAALGFDWSLGLKGLTYGNLYRLSAVHRGMRVAARFSAMVAATLVLLFAYGARRLLRMPRSPTTRGIVCGALCAGVLFHLRLDPRLQPYLRSIPSIYARVTPDMVLAQLPRYHDLDYMYFSTRHWAHLLGGYSGFLPVDELLERGLRAFPSPERRAQLHRHGATHLTYNCALEEQQNRCGAVLDTLDGNPTLELIASERWERADVRLYRFR